MVVLPFVPVTAATASSADGSPKKRSAATGIARRTLGTTSCGTCTVDRPLDDERDGTCGDRLRGEVVAVGVRPGHAEEERPRGDGARVVGEVANLGGRAVGAGVRPRPARAPR